MRRTAYWISLRWLNQEPRSTNQSPKIGPYKLLQQIGEGGMGVVYMAEQPSRSSGAWR
jgi:serine/threonine protein kinase